jgi:hypothetical protein
MNVVRRALAAAFVGCLISQILGCASSSLVAKWEDPTFQAPPLGKMLVIAVRKDAAKRRIWEDAFSGELSKHGVAATSSYRLFPDTPPDTNQVLASVQGNGFDGILVILRLPTETDTNYVKGYMTTDRDVRYGDYTNPYYTSLHRPYWQRYSTYYHDIEHPGYIDSQSVDIRSIDVTATGNGGRLIWNATSRTPKPGSVLEVQRGIARLVISELAKKRIISSRK